MPGIYDTQNISALHNIPLRGGTTNSAVIEAVKNQIADRITKHMPDWVPELKSLRALNYQSRVSEVLRYTGLSNWIMRAFSPVECYHSPDKVSPQDTASVISLLVIDPSLITDNLAILLSQKVGESNIQAKESFKKLSEFEQMTLKIELVPALRELLMSLIPIDGEWSANGRISYVGPGHRFAGMIMIFQEKKTSFKLESLLAFSEENTPPKPKITFPDVWVTPLIFSDALSAVRSGEHAKSSLGKTFHFIELLREEISSACLEWGSMSPDERTGFFIRLEGKVLGRKDLYFTTLRSRIEALQKKPPNSQAQLAILRGLDSVLAKSVTQLMWKWRYLWARSAYLRYDIERQSEILFELIEEQLSIYTRVGSKLNSIKPLFLAQMGVNMLLPDMKNACRALWVGISTLLSSPYIHRIRGLRPFVDDITQLEVSYQNGAWSKKAADYIRELLKSLLLLKKLAFSMASMRAEDFVLSGSIDIQKKEQILSELLKVENMLESRVFLPQVTITGKTADEFVGMLTQIRAHIIDLSTKL